jgi:hypothetical protein
MVVHLITNNSPSGSKIHHSQLTFHYSPFSIHQRLAKRYFPSPLGEGGFDKVEVGRSGEGARLSRADEVFSSLITDHSPLTVA